MWHLSDDEFLAAWQPLPRVTQLQDLNPFPRGNRIVFREHDHKYFVDGQLVPRSVTGLLHEYSAGFDPSRALESMKNGRNWDAKRMGMEEQGLGISDDEILARWSRIGWRIMPLDGEGAGRRNKIFRDNQRYSEIFRNKNQLRHFQR